MSGSTDDTRRARPRVPRFNIGLYEEHLEEASFLWEQRRGLLDDPEVTWLDIEEFEERFEAHVDALIVGADLALEVCREHAASGDAGELHTTLRAFCRQERRDLLDEALDAADPEDADVANAIADALTVELPAAWTDDVVTWLAGENPVRITAAARVLGYRRAGAAEPLIAALRAAPESCRADLAWALGRVGSPGDEWPLVELARSEDSPARAAAAIAALRLGCRVTARQLTRHETAAEWASLPLALVGGPEVVATLLARERAETLSPDAWIALGAIGDPSAVEPAIGALTDEESAAAAADALWLITGADLYEEVFVPDEIDEDELFPEEREKLARGESLRPEGFPPAGTTIVRLARDPAVWSSWWQEQRSRFERGVCYRGGQPASPRAILATIAAERTPRRLRQLACEELAVRYGARLALETESPVAHQKRALVDVARWAETEGTRFSPGAWYFAAELVET